MHVDEGTSHLHVKVIPVVDGKLNASKFLAGSKYRLSELQDLYHEEVGKKYGMDRGERGSTAKHIEVSDFHKNQAAALQRENKRLSRMNAQLNKEITELKQTLRDHGLMTPMTPTRSREKKPGFER